jgi:hypothetical protein
MMGRGEEEEEEDENVEGGNDCDELDCFRFSDAANGKADEKAEFGEDDELC